MEQTNDRTFLETEPVGKLLLKLALPTVAAQLINMMYNIVDRMYIGHIASVGDLALAGVGVCGPILTMIGAFSSLIGVGGAPLLGVQGAVVKAHGSSNAHAFSCAIGQAIKMVNGHVVEIIEKGVAKMNSQDAQ